MFCFPGIVTLTYLDGVAFPHFKKAVQSESLSGLRAASRSGGSCDQEGPCTASSDAPVVPLPRLGGPSDSHLNPGTSWLDYCNSHFMGWRPPGNFNGSRMQQYRQWWACLGMPGWFYPTRWYTVGLIKRCRLSGSHKSAFSVTMPALWNEVLLSFGWLPPYWPSEPDSLMRVIDTPLSDLGFFILSDCCLLFLVLISSIILIYSF